MKDLIKTPKGLKLVESNDKHILNLKKIFGGFLKSYKKSHLLFEVFKLHKK